MDTIEFHRSVTPCDVYIASPPSPPHVYVPHLNENQTLEVTGDEVHTRQDLADEIKAITSVHHFAVDQGRTWQYSMRRSAQLILPFLYLGPFAASRDLEFLRREQMTMLLAIRDTKSAMARLLSGDKAAAELGIESVALDVAGKQELIAAFPQAIEVMNRHLVTVHRQQVTNSGIHATHGTSSNANATKKGKILVFCESGNDRSASVVVAYLMAIYSLDLVSAIQFVASQRFCVALDDSLKNLLWSFHEILQAQRDVRQANLQLRSAPATSTISGHLILSAKRSKRTHEETVDDMEIDRKGMDTDEERFEDRRYFVPFIDVNRS